MTDRYSVAAYQIAPTSGITVTIEEEQSAEVNSGDGIKYTALSSGCMAVTAYYARGGGAGVHLAMIPQGTSQWTDFEGYIEDCFLRKDTISKVYIDCDLVGGWQGWRVKSGHSEPIATFKLTEMPEYQGLFPNEKKKTINFIMLDGCMKKVRCSIGLRKDWV